MRRGPTTSRRLPILPSLYVFQRHGRLRMELINTITLDYLSTESLNLDTVKHILRWRYITLAFNKIPCLSVGKQKRGAQFI